MKQTLTERLERFGHWATFSPWVEVALIAALVVLAGLYVWLHSVSG